MSITRSRTRHLWRLARLFVVALVLVCGCRTPAPGVVVEHRPGDGAKACPVPYAATYVLHSVDETGTGATLLERAAIQDKFQVGFIRQADGALVAYAGGRKFPLPEGHYVWQIVPNTQKTRGELAQAAAGKVLITVGMVVGSVVVVAVYVAMGILSAYGGSGGHN